MIIDRIFSLVNKRTLSDTISTRIAKTNRIKHPSYAFEKLEDGSYNVAIFEGAFTFFYLFTMSVRLVPFEEKYRLVANLKWWTTAWYDIFLIGFPIVAFLEDPIMTIPMFLGLSLLFVLSLLSVRHFAFNDVEQALRQAEYVSAE